MFRLVYLPTVHFLKFHSEPDEGRIVTLFIGIVAILAHDRDDFQSHSHEIKRYICILLRISSKLLSTHCCD